MFNKSIINSSKFLMMPHSTQNLYFHLGMNADDDGFCEHFAIMRMTESKPDDLKILQAKGFVNVFDDKVLIIMDWKENNYLRADRYKASRYLEIYKEELALLSENDNNLQLGIPVDNLMGDKRDTQYRLGKVRLDKNIYKIEEKNVDKLWTEMIDEFKEKYAPSMIQDFEDYWRQVNPNGKKELWQIKKVFDIARRLSTWNRNQDKWNHAKNQRFIKDDQAPKRQETAGTMSSVGELLSNK